jgi:hypothetical protein
LDQLDSAQSVLEAMGAGSVGAGGVRNDGTAVCAEAPVREKAMRQLATREAVELLAREWPDDYPAGAVEWLLFESEDKKKRRRVLCLKVRQHDPRALTFWQAGTKNLEGDGR